MAFAEMGPIINGETTIGMELSIHSICYCIPLAFSANTT